MGGLLALIAIPLLIWGGESWVQAIEQSLLLGMYLGVILVVLIITKHAPEQAKASDGLLAALATYPFHVNAEFGKFRALLRKQGFVQLSDVSNLLDSELAAQRAEMALNNPGAQALLAVPYDETREEAVCKK
jgi:hypothetical protein